MRGQRHAVVVLLQRIDFPAAQDRHVPEGAGACIDRVLDVGLVDRDVRGIAACAAGPVQFEQQVAVRVAVVIGVDCLRVAQRVIDVGTGLHDARGFAVDVREARQAVGRRPAFEDDHAMAGAAQHRCGDEAGRAVADDRDVAVFGGAVAVRARFGIHVGCLHDGGVCWFVVCSIQRAVVPGRLPSNASCSSARRPSRSIGRGFQYGLAAARSAARSRSASCMPIAFNETGAPLSSASA